MTLDCPVCGQSEARNRFQVRGFLYQECLGCGVLTAPAALAQLRQQNRPESSAPAPDYEGDYFARSAGGTLHSGYYDYEAELQHHLRNYRPLLAFLRRLAAGPRLLDVGCATGHFLLAAQAAGFEGQGLDVSATAIETLRQKTGLPGQAARIEDFIPDAPLDVITLWETLEHLPDPVSALKRIKTWLKPGGLLLLCTGDHQSPLSRLLGRAWWYLIPPDHCIIYHPESLRELLSRAGFRCVEQEHILWHDVQIKNVLLKLARVLELPATGTRRVLARLPELPVRVFHGTTLLAAARPCEDLAIG